jgi:hypothetical protein
MVVILTVLAGTHLAGCGSSPDGPQSTATAEPFTTAFEWPEPKSDPEDGGGEGFIVQCIRDYAAAKTRFNAANNDYESATGKDWSVADARRKVSTNMETKDDRMVRKAYLEPWRVILRYPKCFQASDVKKARQAAKDFG